ncbi:hypothetical protein [Vibrio owensii]|uniref:hypothetical protein n=1 Tax=Vibrio harveyi group TaxID=717610 RepID=UPI003CC62D43
MQKTSFTNKQDEAQHVVDWHLHSDKTTDPKLTDMTLEEAEIILYADKYTQDEAAALNDSQDS